MSLSCKLMFIVRKLGQYCSGGGCEHQLAVHTASSLLNLRSHGEVTAAGQHEKIMQVQQAQSTMLSITPYYADNLTRVGAAEAVEALGFLVCEEAGAPRSLSSDHGDQGTFANTFIAKCKRT
jgi:dihydroxyacetone kinase